MPADRAIEDAFRDLQAHQMATLAAMQGALQTTLARFSPSSIRARAETRGLLAKILPWFDQVNGQIIALLLPTWAGLTFGLRRLSKVVEPPPGP